MQPTEHVLDVGAGQPGALPAVAQEVQEALTTVGFFVLTGHDVPLPLIERTFAEARRFHALPMDKKLALKLNEHNNGYMVMGRYAVRTSQLNNNDQGDLNEALRQAGVERVAETRRITLEPSGKITVLTAK